MNWVSDKLFRVKHEIALRDAIGITIDDPVLYKGIIVGYIRGITLKDDLPLITVQIDRSVEETLRKISFKVIETNSCQKRILIVRK